MALLFHGMHGEATVRRIFREGLVPQGGSAPSGHWAHRLTGAPRGELTFLSTSPVAGKGGDPVSFALGFPGPRLANPRGEPGFLIVVDLPPEALFTVRAVVPNGELDAYIEACWVRDFLARDGRFDTVLRMARALASRGVRCDAASIGRALEVRLKRAPDGLFSSGEASAGRWLPFLSEYTRFVDLRGDDFATKQEWEAARSKLLRRYGVELPAWIEEDSHSRYCALCVGGLVEVEIGLRSPGDPPGAGRAATALGAEDDGDIALPCFCGLPVGRKLAEEGGLADLLRVVRAYFDAREPGALDDHINAHQGGASFEAFCVAAAEAAKGGKARLPALWRADFGRSFSGRDLIRPDRQVIIDGVPAKFVLGAIALTDGRRLLGRFERGRGRRGSVLAQLWSFAHKLRDLRGNGPQVI